MPITSYSKAKIAIHFLLGVYAVILSYVILGLIFNYQPSAAIFFDLSFALLIFAFAQTFYELGIKKGLGFIITTSVIGFLAEVLGTNVGVPFGKYHYTDFLGPKVLGVPIVVPFVWFVISYLTMSIGYKAFFAKSNLDWKKGVIALALLCAYGSVSWDFLIDPMFSSYGYWIWDSVNGSPSLAGIPISNFVGWFVIVFLMIIVYTTLFGRKAAPLFQRQNRIDSAIVYILLIVDGAVANLTLGHLDVTLVGVASMFIFLLLSKILRGTSMTRIESVVQS